MGCTCLSDEQSLSAVDFCKSWSFLLFEGSILLVLTSVVAVYSMDCLAFCVALPAGSSVFFSVLLCVLGFGFGSGFVSASMAGVERVKFFLSVALVALLKSPKSRPSRYTAEMKSKIQVIPAV